MDLVNVFEQEGFGIGVRAGVMKRQARGGGSMGVGTSSAEKVEATADGPPDGPGTGRLRRRLVQADLRAVPEVRRALRELLVTWGKPGRSDVAELLTSELVTNALIHTEHDAVLTATVTPHGLRVEVRDFVARRPRLHVPDADCDTHGRGLFLVQSLADAWGVRSHGVGKAVWFELDADAV